MVTHVHLVNSCGFVVECQCVHVTHMTKTLTFHCYIVVCASYLDQWDFPNTIKTMEGYVW